MEWFLYISELMLATLFRETIKIFSFWIQFKNNQLIEILQVVICHINDYINTIYEFNKPFLDNKISISRNMGPLQNTLKN